MRRTVYNCDCCGEVIDLDKEKMITRHLEIGDWLDKLTEAAALHFHMRCSEPFAKLEEKLIQFSKEKFRQLLEEV